MKKGPNIPQNTPIAGGAITTKVSKFGPRTSEFKIPTKGSNLDALVDVSQHSFAIVSIQSNNQQDAELQVTEMTSSMVDMACFPIIMQAQTDDGKIHTLLCHADSNTNILQIEGVFRRATGAKEIMKFAGVGADSQVVCKFNVSGTTVDLDAHGNETARSDASPIDRENFEKAGYKVFSKSLDGGCIAVDCSKMHGIPPDFAQFEHVNRDIVLAKNFDQNKLYSPVIDATSAAKVRDSQIVEVRVQSPDGTFLPDGQRNIMMRCQVV